MNRRVVFLFAIVYLFTMVSCETLYYPSHTSPSSSGSSYTPPPVEKVDFPEPQCTGCQGKGYYILYGNKYTCKVCNGTGKKP